jgi:diketogulonate reductase-like aldo/keto reductase
LRVLSNLLSSLCVYCMRAWAEAASPASKGLIFGGAFDIHHAGSRAHPRGARNARSTIRTLGEVARQHHKSVAQVMLRWHLQEGRSAIPKSTKPARIAENFDVFDFELSRDQIAAIDALDTGARGGPIQTASLLKRTVRRSRRLE